ncbi:DASH outer kinetochore protein [Mycena sp. CBHHK59/15]|nr:DASH outer kinetochore protein [Mycena sp. CBHHK59/15]
MSQVDDFFERERDKFSREISSEFEELLSSTNSLNRKLEEVLGMTKEYATIAALWESFYKLMRESGQDGDAGEEQAAGTSAVVGKSDSAQ